VTYVSALIQSTLFRHLLSNLKKSPGWDRLLQYSYLIKGDLRAGTGSLIIQFKEIPEMEQAHSIQFKEIPGMGLLWYSLQMWY